MTLFGQAPGYITNQHVPERLNFKLCFLVYCCLHGLDPEYFSEDFRLVSKIILAKDCVRPPAPTSWFMPHAGPHLATEHFRLQELAH